MFGKFFAIVAFLTVAGLNAQANTKGALEAYSCSFSDGNPKTVLQTPDATEFPAPFALQPSFVKGDKIALTKAAFGCAPGVNTNDSFAVYAVDRRKYESFERIEIRLKETKANGLAFSIKQVVRQSAFDNNESKALILIAPVVIAADQIGWKTINHVEGVIPSDQKVFMIELPSGDKVHGCAERFALTCSKN